MVEESSERNPGDVGDETEEVEEISPDDTVVLSVDDDDDDIGDLSAELNIEELVAKLEATDSDDVARTRQIKRRLEELRDERESMKDLDSTYNFNLDEDL